MKTVKEHIEAAFRHHRNGDLATAAFIYDSLLQKLDEIDPATAANLYFGYGSLLAHQEKYGLAIKLLKDGLAQCPNFAPIWNNLAVAYRYAGRRDASLAALEKALSLDADQPETLASLSGHYLNDDNAALAEKFARRSLAVSDNPSAHMHLGIALLEQGRYDEAWPHYESRWDTLDRIKDKRPYQAPRWNGGPVGTLAIHGEQGLGDEIMFMSLFPKARLFANRIVIECAERLVPWFSASFGVPCYPNHDALIEAEGEPDAYIPMGSLPLVLGLPTGRAYLSQLAPIPSTDDPRPLIGLAWKGGTQRTNKSDRSLDMIDFLPIMNALPKARFISVQYGGEEIREEATLHDLEYGPRDFDSLTHTIWQCDLVVSVCQTAVHQAGAMGVPCFALVPRKAAWRYCGERMPWYNSVRLFRQEIAGEWDPVIEYVACEAGKLGLSRAA